MIIALDQAPEADNGPIAHLRLTLDQLTSSNEVLRAAVESFDDERALILRSSQGVHVWLIEFGGGRPGTTMLAPRGTLRNDALIDEITGSLGLSPSVVVWRVTESEE